MRILCFIAVMTLLGSCATEKRVIVIGESPGLTYSIDLDKAARSANYLSYGKKAEVCPELSSKANLILSYWITREFRNTLSWQVTHNNAKGAFAFIEDEELSLVSQVEIMNPIAVIKSCTYTQPFDSLGYLVDFAKNYSKIGVGYAKIRYKVPGNDSLHQYGEGWQADVILVIVE